MDINEIIKKLRMDKSQKRLIVNAPEAYYAQLKEVHFDRLPEMGIDGNYDFVQIFATTQKELEKLVVEVGKAGQYDCLYWACYPKGSGKIKSDMKRETVWDALALTGLQAVSQISIDETWSALRGRPQEMVGK